MLTGYAQMMHCWEAGPHRSQLTEGGRTATPEPGGDGCTEEEEGEKEEEERKVLSQQHEWIQTGGERMGKARKGILKWSIRANTRVRDETRHVSRVNNWS